MINRTTCNTACAKNKDTALKISQEGVKTAKLNDISSAHSVATTYIAQRIRKYFDVKDYQRSLLFNWYPKTSDINEVPFL